MILCPNMPTKCAIKGCKNYFSKGDNEHHFFRFPKREDVKNLWVSSCNRDDKFSISHSRICSDHFEESDFENLLEFKTIRTKLRLKENVVPTKNLKPTTEDVESEECDHLQPEAERIDEICVLPDEVQQIDQIRAIPSELPHEVEEIVVEIQAQDLNIYDLDELPTNRHDHLQQEDASDFHLPDKTGISSRESNLIRENQILKYREANLTKENKIFVSRLILVESENKSLILKNKQLEDEKIQIRKYGEIALLRKENDLLKSRIVFLESENESLRLKNKQLEAEKCCD